jgi:hypothetical protein
MARKRPVLVGAHIEGKGRNERIVFPLTLENMQAYMTIVTAAKPESPKRKKRKSLKGV